MKTLLHIVVSPRGEASESFRLSRAIVDILLIKEPMVVVHRMLSDRTIEHIDADYATSQGGPADISGEGSMVRSEKLVRELEAADIVVIGTPMHNLTVPSTLKVWIDHIVRARRTFDVTPQGKVGRLSDRPVFVAVSSGGRFSGERARQPDFLTPYLTAVFGMIGLHSLKFFSVQGTGSGEKALAAERLQTDQAIADYFSLLSKPASTALALSFTSTRRPE